MQGRAMTMTRRLAVEPGRCPEMVGRVVSEAVPVGRNVLMVTAAMAVAACPAMMRLAEAVSRCIGMAVGSVTMSVARPVSIAFGKRRRRQHETRCEDDPCGEAVGKRSHRTCLLITRHQ